jgi:hypothetical protein
MDRTSMSMVDVLVLQPRPLRRESPIVPVGDIDGSFLDWVW